jgi:hypothetical protein
MRFVQEVDPCEFMDSDGVIGCEACNSKNPAIVEVGIKGVSFRLCAVHAAQIVKELAPILGSWANDAAHDKCGHWQAG